MKAKDLAKWFRGVCDNRINAEPNPYDIKEALELIIEMLSDHESTLSQFEADAEAERCRNETAADES